MSVTAKKLSESGARGHELDGIIREHLQVIDNKLLHADRTWGRNTVIYDLPVVFSLPGLDKRDAQRIVYSAIIRSLEKRGFETRILLEERRCAICIAWMTDLDSSEVEAMSALIRSKRITSVELDPFLTQGAVPAPNAVTSVRVGVAPPPAPLRVTDSSAVMRPRGGVVRRHDVDNHTNNHAYSAHSSHNAHSSHSVNNSYQDDASSLVSNALETSRHESRNSRKISAAETELLQLMKK